MASNWGQSSPPHPYQPVYAPAPGPSAPYAEPYVPPAEYAYGYGQGGGDQSSYGGDHKSPFEGDRFKPKKRINDPIFLILFIAQVSPSRLAKLCATFSDNFTRSSLDSLSFRL